MDAGKNIQKWIEESRREYDSFDEKQWTKIGFEPNGGYLVVWSDRIPTAKASKNSRDIFRKESDMCRVFARNGYRLVMLEEQNGVPSPDVLINGIQADLKKATGINNIEKYAKKAVRKQGAKLVLFQLDKMDDEIARKLTQLSNMGINGKYFITGSNKTYDF